MAEHAGQRPVMYYLIDIISIPNTYKYINTLVMGKNKKKKSQHSSEFFLCDGRDKYLREYIAGQQGKREKKRCLVYKYIDR
jgi:hypothetical protein